MGYSPQGCRESDRTERLTVSPLTHFSETAILIKLLGYPSNNVHVSDVYKKSKWGDFLVVQWLRLCASNVRGTGSIPGQETKIPHARQPK